MSSKQSVVVVGGGGAGHAIARSLSQKLDPSTTSLTLVTARPFYTHLPATVRMTTTAKGKLDETALVPYDKLFANKNGNVKIGRVSSIQAKEGKGGVVLLDGGDQVAYDVLVLATGSSWKGPIDLPDSREDALAHVHSWRQKFEDANGIVIAGGGSVGCEFAGEIKDYFPNKPVTIVHAGAQLLNDTYPDKFRKKLEKDIRARGINIVFEDFIDNFEQSSSVVTRKGKQIEGDLIVASVGGRPATGFISASLGASALDDHGRVRVKPTLQLEEHPSIFAAGDIVAWKEQKQLAKCPKYVDVVTANVISFLKGGALSKQYTNQPELIIVTNGLKGGTAYLGIAWGIVLGNFMSSSMKSKDLFVPAARKGLGMA